MSKSKLTMYLILNSNKSKAFSKVRLIKISSLKSKDKMEIQEMIQVIFKMSQKFRFLKGDETKNLLRKRKKSPL